MSCLYKALLAGRDSVRFRSKAKNGWIVCRGALSDARRRNDLDPAAARLIILIAIKDNVVKSQCGYCLFLAIFLPL